MIEHQTRMADVLRPALTASGWNILMRYLYPSFVSPARSCTRVIPCGPPSAPDRLDVEA